MGKSALAASLVALLLLGGEVRAEDPPSALLERMQSDDYRIRRSAVWAARGRKQVVLRDELLRLAERDPHAEVRGAAFSAFATVEEPRVVPSLLKIASAKGFAGPHGPMFDVLGDLRDSRAVPVLMDGLDETAAWATRAAVALGKMRVAKAFEPVCEFYVRNAADPRVAEDVPQAILAIDPKRGLDFLLSRFRFGGPTPRRHLVGLLRRGRSTRVQAVMLEFLTVFDQDLRQSAIRVLGAVGDRKAVPKLGEHVRKEREDLAVAAVALGEIGDPKGAGILSEWLQRPDLTKHERICIARGLASTPDPKGLGRLLDAMDRETHAPARVQMMAALARLGDRRAVADLAERVDDVEFCDQPGPSVTPYAFPYNVHVGAVALWAIRSILDGKPPRPIEDIAADPKTAEPPAWFEKERERFDMWWEAHSADEDLRYER